tara:strand:- start:146 stop:658 length:513 start_codon:yes stop_codon:yes gene_type:complete
MMAEEIFKSHTITALVEDKPGVLNRIVSMFRRRNYNISSLAVGHSEIVGMSRMTFVVECDYSILHLVTTNLDKLVEVIEVENISNDNSISRELVLIKINSDDSVSNEILHLVDKAGAKILDRNQGSMIIEITGNEDVINLFLLSIKKFEVEEIMRTGVIAMNTEQKYLNN